MKVRDYSIVQLIGHDQVVVFRFLNRPNHIWVVGIILLHVISLDNFDQPLYCLSNIELSVLLIEASTNFRILNGAQVSDIIKKVLNHKHLASLNLHVLKHFDHCLLHFPFLLILVLIFHDVS